MKAGELARVLASLPEDMPVLVAGRHIDRIYKSPDETTHISDGEEPTRCETGRCVIEWHYTEVPAPAHIDIHGGVLGRGPRIGEPEPAVAFKAHGRARWPRHSGGPDGGVDRG